MGDFLPLVDLPLKLIQDYITRIQEAKDRRRDQVVITLTKLLELIQIHCNAIDDVVAPLLEVRDLMSTCRNYRRLAYNAYFPVTYGLLKGQLERAREGKQFRKEEMHKQLDGVLSWTAGFQSKAFLLEIDSYNMATNFSWVARHWVSLPPEPELASASTEPKTTRSNFQGLDLPDLGTVLASFKLSYQIFQPGAELTNIVAACQSQLSQIVSKWCEGWQFAVHQYVTGGGGLPFIKGIANTIGNLLVKSYE